MHVDNPFKSPVVLSLCTGMRGLERGLERAIGNITVAAYVEIEAFVIYNLVRQMEQGMVDAAPVWTDIKTFPAEQFHKKIHWIIGGYPCQPFSVAGLQKGTDDHRHLWPYIKESIGIIQPCGCFFENVPNHINIGYREVRQDLEEMGYTVKEGFYSAEEVGAPQERKRLYILAIKLGYAKSIRGGLLLQSWRPQQPDIESSGSSKKLGDPGCVGKCQQNSEDGSFTLERHSRTDSSSASEELANSSGQGLEGLRDGESVSRKAYSESASCSCDKWPAGQGSYQYDWEENRVVEPGLGCTVNGYNFRTDLLRMYGNGVVEQTAELAFIDLMNKHLSTVD